MLVMERCLRSCPCRWKLMHHALLLLSVFFVSMLMLFYSISSASNPLPRTCSRQAKPASHQTAVPCSPRWDLMFLKMHKAGSSTVLNILFRYGEKHQLKFAFPSGRNDFNYPEPFDRHAIAGHTPTACYNVIANHMRFNAAEVRQLLPTERVYFTILRQPAHLFESSFHYYAPTIPLTWRIPGPDKMASFLRDPRAYYSPGSFNSHYLRNLQFFDLGFDKDMNPLDPVLQDIFQELEGQFALVMLLEYFDESLVLLKDLLCWELEDVLYFPLNAREASAVAPPDPALEAQAQAWNQIDALLYAHFNRTFWRKVEIFGRGRMAWEVAELRWLNAQMVAACIEGGGPVGAAHVREAAFRPWQPAGKQTIVGYNRKQEVEEPYREICNAMLTPEMQYMGNMGVSLWKMRLWAYFRDLVNW
ncbi:galactosylceramide sulfotransferase-like [Heterodontus francisci]|uniref:galactosylceramide sulfotransferase-like n=1 Tax=Heterodontus francisci TaxID=7792 RepID=UPI00355B9BD8